MAPHPTTWSYSTGVVSSAGLRCPPPLPQSSGLWFTSFDSGMAEMYVDVSCLWSTPR